jgi:hypothetical protein
MSVMRAMVIAIGVNPIDVASRSGLGVTAAGTALETGHIRGEIVLTISPD